MPNTRIGTHWKKPPTKVYDYNYNLGEHYYKPQLRHAEQKFQGRSTTPPRAKTFAERFVEDPVYGSYGTPNYRSPVDGPRRGSFGSEDIFGARKPSGDRAAGPGERFRLGPSLSQDDSEFVRTPRLEELNDFIKGKLAFLDPESAPATGRGPSPGRKPGDDAFDEPFFQQKREMKASNMRKTRQFSPEFDMAAEEAALKSSFKNRRLAQQQFDEDFEEPKVESMASRFRAKLRAAQEETGDTDEYESRISKIRSRARARMADMEDDFEDLSVRPSTGERQNRVGFADEAGGSSSKSLKITKRSVRTTYED